MEHSELVRARTVRRMLGPGAISATELSRETGIPQPTLSRWLRGAASLRLVTSKPEPPNERESAVAEKRPQDWSPMERMRFVLDADGLGEQELGELLRRRGVHREQLDAWRAAAAAGDVGAGLPPRGVHAARSRRRVRDDEAEAGRDLELDAGAVGTARGVTSPPPRRRAR